MSALASASLAFGDGPSRVPDLRLLPVLDRSVPDVLLPTQILTEDPADTPERRLLRQHLKDTLYAVMCGPYQDAIDTCEGWFWIFYDDVPHLHSFEYVCCHLDWNPDHLRRGLRRWLSVHQRWLTKEHCLAYVFNPPVRRPTLRFLGPRILFHLPTRYRGRRLGVRPVRGG